MKKIVYLVLLFAYVLAVIGGVGYACYGKAYVIAVAIVVLGLMAVPTVKNIFDKMME